MASPDATRTPLMGFWLKKTISLWLMPLPLCLALLAIGLALAGFKPCARFGRRLALLGLLLLAIFSHRTLSVWLVTPFEATYQPIPELAVDVPLPAELADCRYVVVLGSGHSDTAGLSAVNRLCEAAQARLLEALRLLHRMPDARLIVSGPAKPGETTHAMALEDAAVSLGFDRARVIRLEDPRDTEDEAQEIKQIVGDAPFVLVTTAWHMPRAMLLMRRAGLHAVAAPAGYTARQSAPREWADLLWDVDSLQRSTAAVHEALGLVWVWVKPHS